MKEDIPVTDALTPVIFCARGGYKNFLCLSTYIFPLSKVVDTSQSLFV